MEVTVLGCGAAFPRAGGACSGFLVRGGGVRVWIDAGNGTMSNLQRHLSYRDVDALVLSHVHADHIADVLPFMYALGFDPDVGRAVPVWSPGEIPALLRGGLRDMSRQLFEKAFTWTTIDGAFEIGSLRIEPFKTLHPVECYGFRVVEDDRVFVYTADTAIFPALADGCRAADLLICEANYSHATAGAKAIHLWAHEAGEVAAKADVARLVLTHIWPTIDPATSVSEAREGYDGPLEAAVENVTYEV